MIHRPGFDAPSTAAPTSGWPDVRAGALEREPPARSWPVAVAALVLALFGAWVAAWLAIEHGVETRRQDLTESLQRAARALAKDTVDSAALGAAIVMGLNEPAFKEAVRGLRERDAPDVLKRLAVARERFGAEAAFLIAADGLVVAHQGAGAIEASATGLNVAYRPYLAQALNGVESVYGAVGAASGERSLIFSAPVYESPSTTGRVIGALLLTMPVGPAERNLFAPGRDWLLLSPQGVVFMSNRAEWLFAVAPSVSPNRLAQIRASRQFGALLEPKPPLVLPFGPARTEARLGGERHLVAHEPVDWHDPGGRWQLVALTDATHAAPWSEPLGFGAAAFVTIAMFGLLLQSALQSRGRNAAIQARFQALGTALERSAMSVIVTDARGRIEWVNPQFERNSLYTLAEVRGKSFDVVSGEPRAPNVRDDMAAALQHGRPWSGRLKSRRKDGSRYCERVSLSPVLDEQGVCLGVVGLHEDVAGNTQAQSDLQRRENVPNAVLEACPDAIVLINDAGTILMVNRKAEVMFGHDRAELIGRSARLLLPPRLQAAFGSGREGFAAALDAAAGEQGSTLIGLRKSGDEFPLDLRLAPLSREGAGQQYVVSVRDITLRQTRQRRLTEIAAQQRAILDHAPPIVLACDGLFRNVNVAFTQLFGLDAETLIGRPTSILFESSEDYAAFSAQFGPRLALGETVRTEWSLRRSDGRTIVARIRGEAVPIDRGLRGAVWLIEPLSGV